MASDAPVADLAAARREAEEALAEMRRCNRTHTIECGCGAYAVRDALLALLAASPEPAHTLPDEVREAAERLALLRMVAAEGCRDKPGSGVTCREAGVPPDEVCEVCRVIKYLSAQGGGR